MTMIDRRDWTTNIPAATLLSCSSCQRCFVLPLEICPECGGRFVEKQSSGQGKCIAIADVPAKYSLNGQDTRVSWVKLSEGPTILAYRSEKVTEGDRVRISFLRSVEGGLRPLVIPL